jgi:hypothetical protein
MPPRRTLFSPRSGHSVDSPDTFFDPVAIRLFDEVGTRPPSSLSHRSHTRKVPKEISPEIYECIVQQSKIVAQKAYDSIVLKEVPLLQKNHDIINQSLQTSDDTPGGIWRLDPTSLEDWELGEAVETLRLKIKAVKQENLLLRQNSSRLNQ